MSNCYLSIFIPTYNRSSKVCKQVKFFLEEIENCSEVELVISNNCSTDDTEKKLLDLCKSKENVYYHCNSENIGIVGNAYKSLEYTCGEYVWIVGDDDFLEKGVVNKVLSILALHKDLNFVFLNHDAIYGNIVLNPSCYKGKYGLIDDTWFETKEDFYNRSTSLVFTTSIIHKRETLNTVIREIPLDGYLDYGWSYIAGLIAINKGNGFFVEDMYVHDQYRGVSWEHEKIASINGCYNALSILSKNGYTKRETKWMQKKFIEQSPTVDFIVEEFLVGGKYFRMSCLLLIKMFFRKPKVILKKLFG